MRALRVSMWLLGSFIMAFTALAVAKAASAVDATPVLLLAGIVLAILGLVGFVLGRRRTNADWTWYEHSRGRRRALTVARRAALALFLVFLLAVAALVVFSNGLASSALPALVAVGALASVACAAGAAIELFAARAPHEAPHRARSAASPRELTWVERAIDARKWEQAQEPTPDAVESALERWGKSNGNGKGTS